MGTETGEVEGKVVVVEEVELEVEVRGVGMGAVKLLADASMALPCCAGSWSTSTRWH